MKRCGLDKTRTRRRPARGYVLVLTLALLVLAASLLVTICRAALVRVAQSHEAAHSLQQRWAAITCRTAILPYAEQILTGVEERQRRPAAVYRATVVLGGDRYDLVLADEQAKANVNALLDQSDGPQTESRIRRALSGSGLGARVRIRTMVLPEAARSAATRPTTQPLALAVSGFGQIFDAVPPADLLTGKFGTPSAATLLTCWGTGQYNIRRISPEALTLAVPDLSGVDVSRLIASRNASFQPRGMGLAAGAGPLAQILSGAGLGPAGAKVPAPFTVSSTCHSLWIVARGPAGARYYLDVLDETDAEHPRNFSFVW